MANTISTKFRSLLNARRRRRARHSALGSATLFGPARMRRIQFEPLEARLLLATYPVLNTADSGPDSLRQAIIDANLNAGADTITFNIPGGGVQTIQPLAGLPTITDPVTIDGYSQPGSSVNTLANGDNAVLYIELDGSLAGLSHGLHITAGNSTVRGLTINNFEQDGIRLETGGSNFIAGNFIGVDPTGQIARANGTRGITQSATGQYLPAFGVEIIGGSSFNVIGTNGDGTDDTAERNVISANIKSDILIFGAGTNHNVVAGNFIGTNADGTSAFGQVARGPFNHNVGVWISSAATFNRIGTNADGIADDAERNIISGHWGNTGRADDHHSSVGVEFTSTTGNVVAGNYIGTDVTGIVGLLNGSLGFAQGAAVGIAASTGALIGSNSDGVNDAAERNIISGNISGVAMSDGGNHIVAGNYIGTDVTGTVAIPNQAGVIVARAEGSLIGGTTAAARNVISGNQFWGVSLSLFDESDIRVQGNFIGVDATGSAPLGNNIGISYGANTAASALLIGGTAPGAGNVISGNRRIGVQLFSFNATVQGNYIGTDATGTVALGNLGTVSSTTDAGVTVSGFNHLIGGASPGARNVISGNEVHGVLITLGSDNVVQGNYIGTDATGTVRLGNRNVGVRIQSGRRNLIGGSGPGEGNIISGNGRNSSGVVGGIPDGVEIVGGFSIDTVVHGNLIGVDKNGNPLGNERFGVFVHTTATEDHSIGGGSAGEGNVIAHNLADGVFVQNANRIRIRGNSIFANGGLGIDLDPNNPNANDLGDADTGVNFRQNYPVLSAALAFSGGTYITGSLNSTADTTFDLDFYANTVADPSGFGEGEMYLGSVQVTTDAGGDVTFAVTVPGIAAAGTVVSATATDPNGNTSEFSAIIATVPFEPATISGTKFHDLNGNGVRDGATASSGPITVPGISDPWLAGMPDGSTASSGDVAPNQSPVLVPLTLDPGSTLSFDVTGCVSFGSGGCVGNNPDGSSGGQHATGAENGISNVFAPWNSLIGVFLGPNQPNLSPAPATLDFLTAANREYLTLSPLLQQAFFIGNGRTSSNQVQQITVPAGATRLFLGTMDGFGWYNNSGAFTVSVNSSTLEPLLANWTIELDAGADTTTDDSAITDVNGQYNFTGLLPDTYRIREVQQSGWTQTSLDPDDILVSTSGQVITGVDFGNHQDDCSPPGVIIGDSEPFNLSTFSVVQYEVNLQPNASWVLSNGNTVATQTVNADPSILLSPAPLPSNVVEGSWRVGSGGDDDFMGFVFGYQDSEHLYLFDWKQGSQTNLWGFAERGMSVKVVNADSPLLGPDLWPTVGNGTRVQTLAHNTIPWQVGVDYDFRLDFQPGEFTITVKQGTVELDSFTIQDSTYTTGQFGFYNSSQHNVIYSGFTSATITPIQTTTIEGTKFHDLDGDGVRDISDPGLAGWTIQLDAGADGSVDDTTTTDGNGNYSFVGLPLGTYRVREVQQLGWTQTTANPSDIVLTTCTDVVSGIDFGNLDESRITGTKFYDIDGSHSQDAGEPGLAYWPIFVDTNGDGIHGIGEPFTYTNLFGNYTFGDLDAGTYRVREVQQPGWVQTTLDPEDIPITANGQVFADVDFGNDRDNVTLITGTKFTDIDVDGVQDVAEGGLAYWPIFVDSNQNEAYDLGEPLTFTNLGGHYAIAGLPVGTYSIREIQRPGWTQTTANPANVDLTTVGQTVGGVDFGNQRDATTLISGRKFFDADSDGVADPGEPGLHYWPIFLDTNNDGVHQAGEPLTHTGWNGEYSFAGVAPGTYRVREIQQTGWTQTTANPSDVVVTANGQTFDDIDFGNKSSRPGPGYEPPTDLEVTKGALRAVAGEQITYTLTVTNKGPADSYGVILGDQLKPGLVFESVTPSQGTCLGGQTIICALGPLAMGESASITIVAHVQSWVVDEIENEVCVYSTATDTEPANNCAIARTPIDTRTDLELVKTADGLRAIAGTDLTYTMRVTNNGPSDSTNVTLEDDLPPEVTFISAVSAHGTCTLEVTTIETVVCDLGTVANGETAIVTLIVHVGAWVPEDAIITNEARVRDPHGSIGTSIIRIPCGRSTDFKLTKTGPFTNLNAEVYYVIEVTNQGPSNSAGPIVGDDLPDDINFWYAVPSQGVCNQQDPLLCNLGPMVVGQSETVTVFVRVPETVIIENVRNEAVVHPPEGDPDPDNNYGGTGGIRPKYSLGITKEAPPEIPPGKYLHYMLHVTNEGPADASNVIVGDTIPAGLIFISARPTQGFCNSLFNPILCFLGPMQAGDEADVEIVVFVPPSIPEGTEFVNRGYGWGGVPPVFDDARTRVVIPPGVSLVKEAPLDVIAGTEMTYTLRTRNRGPADSTNITLEDVLPPEVEFRSAEPSQGTCTDVEASGQTTVSCALGDIPSGGVATVEIVVFVPSFILPGTIIANEGCVTALLDSDWTYYCDVVHTGVGRSDTGLIKRSIPGPVTAGENIEYRLEAFNLGPTDARTFVLGDTLPAPLVFVSATTTQGTCDYISGVVRCDIGYLAVGQHEFVTIVAFVPPTTPDGTVIENTACIIECGHDIFHDNDCSTVRNTIRAQSVLTGVKFNDLDGDGVQDIGELGIPGWQMFLDLDGDNTLDANERSTFTDANGTYTFIGLGKTTWFVREVQDPGWLQTTTNPAGVTVTGLQQSYAGGDFGNKQGSFSGRVYIDPNNDGIFDMGDIGIGGVTITLTGADDLGSVNRSTQTGGDGSYRFGALRPGTYRVIEGPPGGYLDGKEHLGNAGGTVGNDEFFLDLVRGQDARDYNFGELPPAKLSGYVYNDLDDNGQIDFGEQAIPGAQITLTGTNDLNEIINQIVTTDTQGYYEFNDLRPGTYAIDEQQPAGYIDGKDTLGTLGGDVSNDNFANIPLAVGSNGLNYNFGDHADVGLHRGQTATIGYWQNKNGQALILSLNGGAISTDLGNWLASNFSNMYGANAGANNLAGKTNSQIAAYYVTLFKQKGQKLDAQVLATAFAAYVTDSDLAGNNAAQYGFEVSAGGTGAATFSVGGSGAAFGVANNTRLTILQILTATNVQTVGGNLYGGSTALRNLANTVYDGINQGGDIY